MNEFDTPDTSHKKTLEYHVNKCLSKISFKCASCNNIKYRSDHFDYKNDKVGDMIVITVDIERERNQFGPYIYVKIDRDFNVVTDVESVIECRISRDMLKEVKKWFEDFLDMEYTPKKPVTIKFKDGKPTIEVCDDTIKNTDLSNAVIENEVIVGLRFVNCNLSNFTISNTFTNNMRFLNCNLKFGEIKDSHIANAIISLSDIQHMLISESMVRHSEFGDCNANNFKFFRSTMKSSSFRNCAMKKSSFLDNTMLYVVQFDTNYMVGSYFEDKLAYCRFLSCNLANSSFEKAGFTQHGDSNLLSVYTEMTNCDVTNIKLNYVGYGDSHLVVRKPKTNVGSLNPLELFFELRKKHILNEHVDNGDFRIYMSQLLTYLKAVSTEFNIIDSDIRDLLDSPEYEKLIDKRFMLKN